MLTCSTGLRTECNQPGSQVYRASSGQTQVRPPHGKEIALTLQGSGVGAGEPGLG